MTCSLNPSDLSSYYALLTYSAAATGPLCLLPCLPSMLFPQILGLIPLLFKVMTQMAMRSSLDTVSNISALRFPTPPLSFNIFLTIQILCVDCIGCLFTRMLPPQEQGFPSVSFTLNLQCLG